VQQRKLAPYIPLEEVLVSNLATQESASSDAADASLPQSITDAVNTSRRKAQSDDDDDGFGEAEPYLAQQWTFARVGASTKQDDGDGFSTPQDSLEPGGEWQAGA
jgi:hypothetical protein